MDNYAKVLWRICCIFSLFLMIQMSLNLVDMYKKDKDKVAKKTFNKILVSMKFKK